MAFSFSNLLDEAKNVAAEKLGRLENLAEQNIPGAKNIVDNLQNAHLGDLSGEVLADLKTGNYAAAGQAVFGKIKTMGNQNTPAEPIATILPADDSDEDETLGSDKTIASPMFRQRQVS